MDELPELLDEAVGDGSVVETIALGGDVVAVARAATYLYRSEGLLSDESVEAFDHDVERFAVDEGRRKSTVRLAVVDDERDFTVPSKVADDVAVAMLEGVLRTTGVVGDGETIRSTFRFSELTLVVTDEQLLKHVGGAVWDDEYEAFRYGDLTGLEFEEGSVATQVVLQADGRQQRVKVPNDHAGRVRQDIQSAVFGFHGVSSLGGLHAAIEPDVEPEDDADVDADSDTDAEPAVDPEGGTDPDAPAEVVTASSDADGHAPDGEATADAEAETDPGSDADADDVGDRDDGFVSAGWSPPADQDITGPGGTVPNDDEAPASGGTAARGATGPSGPGGAARDDGSDVGALAERVDDLAERIDRQNELLESQQETIELLVEQLRGR